VGTLLSLYRPLWTDNLLAKAAARRVRRYRRPRRISHWPADAAAEREILHLSSKAGSNVAESAAILMEFVRAARALGGLAKRMHDTGHAGDDIT
jgi:hypothetical protein